MSCCDAERSFVTILPAPSGWSAYYALPTEEHVEVMILPVASWVVHRCPHGYTMDTMVLTARGLGIVANSSIEVEGGSVADFLVVVAPHQDADKMVAAVLAHRGTPVSIENPVAEN